MTTTTSDITFTGILDSLGSLGTGTVIAAFQVGWEAGRLRSWEPGSSGHDNDMTRAACSVFRIESALSELSPSQPSPDTTATPHGLFDPPSFPSVKPLRDAVNELNSSPTQVASLVTTVDEFQNQMRRALLVSRAAGPLPQAPGGDITTTPASLADAHELGIRLAAVCSQPDSILEPESDASRARSLLGGLTASLPSAAAYSVARHLEDWATWLASSTLDSTVPSRKTLTVDVVQAAMKAQAKTWESILTGQSLAKNYVTGQSYADAADHLLVASVRSAGLQARAFGRTVLGRLLLGLIGLTAAAIVLAVVSKFVPMGPVASSTSGASNATLITVVVGTLGSAAGIFHITRQRLAGAFTKVWSMTEPELVTAEVLEAIAVSTRCLPAGSPQVLSKRATGSK